jgi:hypothetical protein
VLGRSDLGDGGVWSLLGQGGQQAWPVEQAEAVDQAGGAVAQDGRPLEAFVGDGVGQGVLGGGRVGAGHPEAIGMVAVATLLGDQLGEAAGMIGGANRIGAGRRRLGHACPSVLTAPPHGQRHDNGPRRPPRPALGTL